MKKLLTILLLCSFISQTQAAILRCSKLNTPGVYSTVQAAHDAANTGDTIHMEPSGSYGSLSMTKQLVIIGTGDYITQNPGYQQSPLVGSIDNLYCYAGSENSVIRCKLGFLFVLVDNIILENSSIYLVIIGGNPSTTISNAVFKRCRIVEFYGGGNYFWGVGNTSPWNSLLLSNCYIEYLYNSNPSANSALMNNCVFNGVNDAIEGSFINRCIFINGVSATNCLGDDNISAGGFGNGITGSNNLTSVDMSTVFQNWNNFNGDNYQLLPFYPNQNIGMYGGTSPYNPACTPAVPSIYQLSIPNNISGITLPITVSTKSNN